MTVKQFKNYKAQQLGYNNWIDYVGYHIVNNFIPNIDELTIEFAQYHVQECIKSIVKDNSGNMNEADIPYLQKNYPLENIK